MTRGLQTPELTRMYARARTAPGAASRDSIQPRPRRRLRSDGVPASLGMPRVDVRGWPKLDDEPEQEQWRADFFDHGLLYFEVEN
jgi:hypothetical protein